MVDLREISTSLKRDPFSRPRSTESEDETSFVFEGKRVRFVAIGRMFSTGTSQPVAQSTEREDTDDVPEPRREGGWSRVVNRVADGLKVRVW
jgi:hypothetical protein